MGEINCNQQAADLDGEANLCTKLRDLCFNDFYWCFVVLLFIIVKYFGWCSNEKQSMKSGRLMRLRYSPKVVMDRNRNMTSSSLSSPLPFLRFCSCLSLFVYSNVHISRKTKKNPELEDLSSLQHSNSSHPKSPFCLLGCSQCRQRSQGCTL